MVRRVGVCVSGGCLNLDTRVVLYIVARWKYQKLGSICLVVREFSSGGFIEMVCQRSILQLLERETVNLNSWAGH